MPAFRISFLAFFLGAACTGTTPPSTPLPDFAVRPDLAAIPPDLAPPRDFSDQEYIADVDGGRLAGGDCLSRPSDRCTQPDGGMPASDPATGHVTALLEGCGESMLPVCSVLHVRYDENGCANRVEYYGDNRAFPLIQCVTRALDQSRSSCAFGRTVTVVGFCE